MTKIFDTIKLIVDSPHGYSRRIICLLQDVLELRERDWSIRSAVDGTSDAPPTIDEIQAVEADERQQYSEQMSAFILQGFSSLPAPAADLSDSRSIGVLQQRAIDKRNSEMCLSLVEL